MALTGMVRLGRSMLARLPEHSRPLVTPGPVLTGPVHLGLGAFHRAHQAVYTEEAIAAAGGDWGIVGVAPRSPHLVGALEAQDRLFSATTLSPAGSSTRVIGGRCPARTEKGYRLDPSPATKPSAGWSQSGSPSRPGTGWRQRWAVWREPPDDRSTGEAAGTDAWRPRPLLRCAPLVAVILSRRVP